MTSVAIVNGSGRFSGITLSVEPYATALRKAGMGVRWYQCVDRGIDPFSIGGGTVVSGAGLPIGSLEMGVNRLWRFPRALRRVPEDVVLVTDPTLLRVATARTKNAVIVHDLLPLTPYADRVDSNLMFRYILPKLRRMDLVIVPTRSLASELVRRRVPSEAIRVVPQTHDLGTHPDHPARSLDRIARSGEVRVLFVGTDRPFKNVDFVLRLAQALQGASSARRFMVTILSQLRPNTVKRVSGLNLSNLKVVSFIPSISNLYEESDVLVHPSLHEGFGRPVMEAMAYGLPVFANRIPSLAEVVGDTSVLLGVDSVEPWVSALESITDPAKYNELAQRGLVRSRAFLPDQFQEAVARAFRERLLAA